MYYMIDDSLSPGHKGLFAENYGTIEKLHVRGQMAVSSQDVAGFIAVNNHGTIKNCSAGSGSIDEMIFPIRYSNIISGGIAGYNYGTVEGCVNLGGITSANNSGGIVGYNAGTITKSYNTGNIYGEQFAGGITAYNEQGSITKTYNTGNITSYNGTSTGGIAGYAEGGVIENSYNTGDINGYFSTGGVVGYLDDGVIAYCYNTGEVHGGYSTCGIAGQYYGNTGSEISNSLSLGKYLSSVARGARVFCGSGFFSGNKARSDMVATVAGIYTNDGIDVTLGTALSSVFSGWNTGIWSIPNSSLLPNGTLPVLLNMPTGTQNPLLTP